VLVLVGRFERLALDIVDFPPVFEAAVEGEIFFTDERTPAVRTHCSVLVYALAILVPVLAWPFERHTPSQSSGMEYLSNYRDIAFVEPNRDAGCRTGLRGFLIIGAQPARMGTADDTTEEGGHHLPAVEDFPRGFGEASWWPFVTAAGGAGLYIGAALFFLGHGDISLVPAVAGPAVFVASVGLFLIGLFGWLYHAFIANFWERGTDEHSANTLRFAMLLFLGTEIATFGAGFVYYFFIRVGGWPPSELPELLSSIVLVNTVILVISSFTFHFAEVALRKGNRRRFLGLLATTLGLGVVFIGGQVYEYYLFIVHESFTLTSGIYASAFFGLTGLHGLHVTLGAVLITIVLVRALAGQYSADRHTSVSTVSMYWHFVDVVWLFLVVVLYVGAAAV
jgi:cytochrome c oxidase subunit 3